MTIQRRGALAGPILAGMLLSGCSVDMGGVAFVNDQTTTVRISTSEAMLDADGSCGGDANLDPASLRSRPVAIAIGISECDLVRLKRERPTDVLIGESGRGQREVQVLYAEPGGREIYLFTDNKLTRIVKPGQG
ncbi:MAG: hypothetical protein MUC44_15150 [Beijerinckiaceae bacterium]|jgi:hypothetical protein|nr:hypothetical protein [Beijerinckiaceae bacterium]